jgi:TrkA domain protein
MNLKETDLPGIGRKYVLHSRSKDTLVMIVHNDGRRELYHMNPKEPDETVSSVTLEDEEARMVSAVMAGITYKPQPLEQLEMTLGKLSIEWIRIEPTFYCVGKLIGELEIRARTGASILAVLDLDKTAQINPGPGQVFATGTTVIAAGEREQIKRMKLLLQNGSL